MRITLRPSITIDGYIADANGECYSWINSDDEDKYDEAVKNAGCEIVGRKTYDQYKEDFDRRENIITYVYTSRSTYNDTSNVKFVHGPITDVVKLIEGAGFSELLVSGGGELNGLLASEGLINEIHLSVHPVFLYAGIPLFGSYKPALSLSQVSSNTDVSGVVQTIYTVKS